MGKQNTALTEKKAVEPAFKSCFVIMPFSKTHKTRTKAYWTNHYETFLRPLISSCGLNVSRSEPLRQNILKDIIHKLVFSDIVVADLTDGNVNVYWELGIRQSFRHCTITIIDEKTKRVSLEGSKKIPFDLAGKSILTYSANDKDNFGELLKKAVNDCLKNPKLPDSEVLETVTGRTSIYQVIHQEEIRQKIAGLIFENTSNYAILNSIIDRANENKNRKGIIKKPERTIGLIRLRTDAIEHLLTERYVENHEDFYLLVAKTLNAISAINQNVLTWNEYCESVDDYFCEKGGILRLMLDSYQNKLLILQESAKKFC